MIDVSYKPIGLIHSPFKKPAETPTHASDAWGVRGKVELYPEYVRGIENLEAFSHIILIYHFHAASTENQKAESLLNHHEQGVFTMRGSIRPNPIGFSVVRLSKIEDNILWVLDMNMVDNTPLLDIKPYLPEFDSRKADKMGYMPDKNCEIVTADGGT